MAKISIDLTPRTESLPTPRMVSEEESEAAFQKCRQIIRLLGPTADSLALEVIRFSWSDFPYENRRAHLNAVFADPLNKAKVEVALRADQNPKQCAGEIIKQVVKNFRERMDDAQRQFRIYQQAQLDLEITT